MLFADIDLNELGFDETGSNWTGIGSSDTTWHHNDSFRGTLDGNGYTISNLKIKDDATDNEFFTGLINVMYGSNTKVKNLNLDNVYIDSNKTYVGGMTGWNLCGLIENCNISGYVKGKSYVGMISGNCQFNPTKIKNSTSSGIVEGLYSGGIAGLFDINPIIESCYSDCKIIGTACGSFVGTASRNSTITNSYCDLEKSGQTKFIGTDDYTSSINIKDSKTDPFAPQELQVKTNLQVGINSNSNSTITVDTGFSLDDLNISVLNEFSARNSLSKIDEMMDKITSKMTEIGATQNRLTSTMEFQDVQINALTSANSIIKDADIAEESSNYIKNQILQNVTSSLLATANQNPQIALQLI